MLEGKQSQHSFAVLPGTSRPMHWVHNIHVVHRQWWLLQSYHMPSMPEKHSQWLGIYFRKVPSAKGAQIRSDRERHREREGEQEREREHEQEREWDQE